MMLAVTLAMYMITAANWAVDIRLLLNELQTYLPRLVTSGIEADVTALVKLNIKLVFAGNTIQDVVVRVLPEAVH